jgi:L-ascorbate metabolism protein UlaG (beta-lactamase superfamily)
VRKRKLVATGVVLVLIATVPVAGCALSGPRYHGPKSDHFDGKQFQSRSGPGLKSTGEILKWMFGHRERGAWREVTDAKPGEPPPRRVDQGALRVTFINHATTLLQLEGVNVLTDPIWSERAAPVSFAGPKRVRPPGLKFEDLPPIDVVLISHNHYDHLDLATLTRLANAFPDARFVVGLGNAPLLAGAGIKNVEEVDWWQDTRVAGLEITSVPMQHVSNRGWFDRNATLWTGYVLASASGPVLFAGDSGFGPHFDEVARRVGPLRLAVLPIGAYKPEWFMGSMHESPAQAVQAALTLKARISVPIHYGTFDLADDGQYEAVQGLREALKTPGAPNFWILDFGEGRDVPP